ncbi:hypothetical protein F4678DRAFT_453890 [Xylaria arbuscula]|nr:hypothetical protein F4678DRAFT_453890 [Xylaria arbuscula]
MRRSLACLLVWLVCFTYNDISCNITTDGVEWSTHHVSSWRRPIHARLSQFDSTLVTHEKYNFQSCMQRLRQFSACRPSVSTTFSSVAVASAGHPHIP